MSPSRGMLVSLFMIIGILGFTLSASLRQLTVASQAADLSRKAEDRDIVVSFSESASMDALEQCLDVGHKKNNILFVSDQDKITLAKNNLKRLIEVQMSTEKREVKVRKLEIFPGDYSGNSTYSQSAEQRPYIKGTIDITYTPLFENAQGNQKIQDLDNSLKQQAEWFIYATNVDNTKVN